MAYVLGEPTVQQYFDANGDPLVNGTIEFYLTGTSTPTSIYSDSSGTAIGTSVTLNSSGAPANSGTAVALFFDTDVTYKIVRKDSSGNEISPTIDPYNVIVPPTYTTTETGGVSRTLASKLGDVTSVLDFGAVGDGVADDLAALQAAVDSKIPVFVPPGLYRVTDELILKDGCNLVGPTSMSGARSNLGLVYESAKHAIIFYDGAGGSNSCVVRASELAVGVEATDFTPQETDDLLDVVFENFVIDANGVAEFGLYCYRLVNCTGVNNITATKAKEYGLFIIGSFTNAFKNWNAYANEKNGIGIGHDIFVGWASTEIAVNANRFSDFVARNNGTGETYNQTTNLLEGHGLIMQPNRANIFENFTLEGNDGAGLYILNANDNFGGPNKFLCGYIEANMSDVVADGRGTVAYGTIINLWEDMENFEFDSTFFSGTNDIWITRTAPSTGERDSFLTFRNCNSQDAALEINSDTPSFKVEGFSPVPTYTDETPDVFPVSFTTGGATLVNTASSVPVYRTIHLTSTTGSSTGALLLGDGKEGDRTTIIMIADAGTSGVITDNGSTINLGNASSITFDDVGDSAELLFTNGAWHYLGGTATVA